MSGQLRRVYRRSPSRLQGLPDLSAVLIGRGFFNKVRALGDYTVVKVASTYGPFRQPLSWLQRNRSEHELVSRYLRVPPTYHVRMRDSRGSPVNVMLQRRLYGELLSEVDDSVLRSEGLRGELQVVLRDLRRCDRKLGFLPDVIGGPPRWGMHDLRRSNNFFVATDGRIWLLDPCGFFFWFSSRNPVGWLYTGLLLWTGRRMLRRSARG